MPFRFLEHTADVQAECSAATFKGLLETAAQAFYAITLREQRGHCDLHRSVSVEGAGREEVLIRWLQELIFLLDTQHFVATEFAFTDADAVRVVAELAGYVCSPEDRAEEVKSATYHDLEVIETSDGLIARVIFDL